MNLLILNNSGREESRIIRLSSSANRRLSFRDLRPPPFVVKQQQTWVAAACKGLLCFCYGDKYDYLLWNPVTDEHKAIPPSPNLPPCGYAGHHPTVCTQFHYVTGGGLGFDVKSGDYKFIKFTTVSYADEEDDVTHSYSKQVCVYSLNKNSWKEIPNPESCVTRSYGGVSVNGFCYWLDPKSILAFDLATDEFSTLPFPDILISRDTRMRLIEYDGSLYFVVCSLFGDQKCFRFWSMEEEDGGVVWVRKENLFVCGTGVLSPLGFCKNGCSFLLQGMDGYLLEYDFLTREMKSIQCIFDEPSHMLLYSYIESNVKLNDEDED